MSDPAVDYDIGAQHAELLFGIATLPAVEREHALMAFTYRAGPQAIFDLFAQFIGLANSVALNAREQAESLLTEHGVHPYTAEKINMPNILGALNGLVLVPGIDPAPLCHGCAFRKGSIANQCMPTTMDAELCSEPGEQPFMCHEDMDAQGNPTAGCRGFAQRRVAIAKHREVAHG